MLADFSRTEPVPNMPRIGITGHMDIAESSVPLVRAALESALLPHAPQGLVGISCIAAGADTLFAEAVLGLGGQLIVVLPAQDYRERKVREADRPRFDDLIAKAASVRVLPYARSNRDAYQAANEALLGFAETVPASTGTE